MIYRVRHTTRYLYSESVSQCHSVAHLLPRNTYFQRCNSARITVNYFGNHTEHIAAQIPHQTLEITAESEVEILAQRQSLSLDFGASCADARNLLPDLSQQENVRAREFTLNSPLVKAGGDDH